MIEIDIFQRIDHAFWNKFLGDGANRRDDFRNRDSERPTAGKFEIIMNIQDCNFLEQLMMYMDFSL